jgi:hypothetical protein
LIRHSLGPKYDSSYGYIDYTRYDGPKLSLVDEPCVTKFIHDNYGDIGGFLVDIGNPQQYFAGNNDDWEKTDKEAGKVVVEKMAITKGPTYAGKGILQLAPASRGVSVVGRGLLVLGGSASGVVEVAGAFMTPFGAMAMDLARRNCSCPKK